MLIPSKIPFMQCQMNWKMNKQWRIFARIFVSEGFSRQRVTGYWDITPHHTPVIAITVFAGGITSLTGVWLVVNVLNMDFPLKLMILKRMKACFCSSKCVKVWTASFSLFLLILKKSLSSEPKAHLFQFYYNKFILFPLPLMLSIICKISEQKSILLEIEIYLNSNSAMYYFYFV